MKRSILLIADIDNLYTRRYIEKILLPDNWKIVIFPIWSSTGKFDDWYREQNIAVYHDTHSLPIIRHIPRLRMWARIRANAFSLAKLGPFDAIHNHYLSQRDLELGYALKRRMPHARWIASFWGSDLLRSEAKQLTKMRHALKACDRITVISSDDVSRIRNQFGSVCADKTAVCDFGVDLYDAIDALRPNTSKADCKAHFGLPEDQPLICLGYNASPPHRHLEMLQALSTLPPDVLSKWSVALQMTYGKSDTAYLAAVRKLSDSLPCQTLFLTDFMNPQESAFLRLAADAFVLAIPTDAFSASLQEYLYAGAHVLCGTWLHYPQLTKLSISMISFEDIGEIPHLLTHILEQTVTDDEMRRRAKLRNLYSWTALRNNWVRLYE